MELTGKRVLLFFLVFLVFSDGFSSVSASTPPAKIVSGFVSNAVTKLMKWAWSLKTTPKTAISGRQMIKFESGYAVETVFDGSKLGIEPHSVELLPTGDLLILDSANSNLYRISSSLSQYTRPKLVAGSAEGYSGHVDGKYREARMNHPKGIAVDDRGNIYVADTMNMAVRKISESGVTTIAGGKRSHGGEHVDGPSEEAKFSNDFDVVYIGSSCSLLVIDRGNRAIREIQLQFDDCAYQYESSCPLGIAVLLAAGFFGYMLGLLQRRVGSLVSSQDEWTEQTSTPTSPYQKPPKSVRPPLIPSENEPEKQEEGFVGSLGKLFVNAGSSAAEMLRSVFPALKRKPQNMYLHQNQFPYSHHQQPNIWPSQESFEVPREDGPPPIETRAPTPRKTYAFMSNDADKLQHQMRQSRVFYSGWEGELQQQQHQQLQLQQQQKYQSRHQQHSSAPQTFYEQSCENTKEIVFGAIEGQEGRREPVINHTHYADSSYDHPTLRFRMGYNRNY